MSPTASRLHPVVTTKYIDGGAAETWLEVRLALVAMSTKVEVCLKPLIGTAPDESSSNR